MSRFLFIAESGHGDLVKKFYPYNYNHLPGTLQRVRLADSLEHALTLSFSDSECMPNQVTIYRMKTPVATPNILNPEILYAQGWSDCALYTREHWCLSPCTLEGVHININTYEFGTYRVPDDEKVNNLRLYILRCGINLTTIDMIQIHSLSMDDLLRIFLPNNRDRIKVSPESAANYINLTTMRTISKVRYIDEKFNGRYKQRCIMESICMESKINKNNL